MKNLQHLQVAVKPIMFPVTEQGLLTKQYKKLITISTDTCLKYITHNCSSNFSAGLEEFPPVSNVTKKKLLLFPSSYLCDNVLKIHSNKNEVSTWV